MFHRFQTAFIATLLAVSPLAYANGFTNYVVNGDFETGDFTGWTTDIQTPFGFWYIYSGGILPISNLTTPYPPGGAYAASTDEVFVSSMIMYQDITLPADEYLLLRYTYYYNNDYGEFVSPDTLDISSENQQARIDIMDPATVDPYSVAPGDVWRNLLWTKPGNPLVVKPKTVVYDVSAYAGQTIRLRFAVADNLSFFFLGADNISIQVGVVPPQNLRGSVIKNGCGSSKDLTYRLTWNASTTEGVTQYLIYRNGVLIASVPNTSNNLSYDDRHRRKGEKDEYKVVAYVSDDFQSEPAVVIIPSQRD